LSLCFIKHEVMKTYGGMGVYLHTFLTLALDGSELVSFTFRPLYLWGKNFEKLDLVSLTWRR
jgi:hypothetical protein